MTLRREDAFANILGSSGLDRNDTRTVALGSIQLRPDQPRKYFDPVALEELTNSIRDKGVLQPVLLRPTDDGYELVAGERRVRAAREAGLDAIPAIVKQLSDDEIHELALLENLNREDLNPLEETDSIVQLLSLYLNAGVDKVTEVLRSLFDESRGRTGNTGVSSEDKEIARAFFNRVGRLQPSSFYSHRLPLLKLPEDILELLRRGDLEYSKARLIARVKDERKRRDLLNRALEGASRQEIQTEIRALNKPRAPESGMNLSAIKRKLTSKRLNGLDEKERARAEQLLQELDELMG